MRKSLRLIIVLLALAVLIFGYFFLKNRPPKENEPDDSFDTISLSDVNGEDIEKIVLDQGEIIVEFVKTNDQWQIVPKPEYPVNTDIIKNLERSFTGMYANRMIEEKADDLSVYGLSSPQAKATAFLKDGGTLTFFLGNQTPTGNNYYLSREGDPAVYAAPIYIAGRFLLEPVNLRVTGIGSFDSQSFRYMKLRTYQNETIEVVPVEQQDDTVLNTMGRFKLVQPYEIPRGVHAENFYKILDEFPSDITAKEFIEDNPMDLARYGLDPPRAELELRDGNGTFHIYAGKEKDESSFYAMTEDKKTIFTLRSSHFDILNANPFTVADKFVLLVNIDFVEEFTVKHEGKSYTGTIIREDTGETDSQGEPEIEETYSLNGKSIEEDPFKKYYQGVIGLIVDAENPDAGGDYSGEPLYHVDYTLNRAPWNAEADFYDYNRDFCVVVFKDSDEFLIARKQLREMISLAEETISAD